MTITLNHLNNIPAISLIESYCQTYTYDAGNNLTNLSHQAKSNTWQQPLTIHPNSNRGTENNNQNNFDANGNLLNLNNIGNLEWHYNNTLNKLTKANKPNTIQHYVYDYQGKRVRTVIESNQQVQSQRDYLPLLDISTNQAKQQSKNLHIGTHILSASSKDNVQTHYQLNSHLQSNTLELDDKAQTLSYEHYYPYGGTAIIAGKDKTQVQQKRYRYTGKERDDSSGLCYYGARYLAPWLARWITPDAAGAGADLSLYVYVGNNPLKYRDPTGHMKKTPEQEAVEEGAVGGVNNIETARPIPRKYKIDRDALYNSSREINRIQEEIFRSNTFRRLGILDSSSRSYYLGEFNWQTIDLKIKQLRRSVVSHITDIRQSGVPHPNNFIQFFASNEYKDLVFNKYQVANCAECALVMLSDLRENHPNVTVEYLSTTKPDHGFNLVNRDQFTSIFEPEKWNKNSLVVDAWLGSVYTQEEFCIVNKKSPHYNMSNDFSGKIQHITKYVKSGVSYRTYEKNHMDSQVAIF
jgi:RHS repeat-associated protein